MSGAGCALSVRNGGTLPLVLPGQVTVTGVVPTLDGKPAANARVAYIARANSPTQRVFASTSDAHGRYTVQVDPASSAAGLEYDVSVEPDPSAGQPRYRGLFRVGTTNTSHDLQLWAPSFVYGHVLDPNGQPLPDVTIALYSVDLGSAKTPLLVGLGKSKTGGEFVIPIPTATAP
jgi:5-hydroxyisourate hydrolase-like protein (transthyretin family)